MSAVTLVSRYSRTRPFSAPLRVNRRLNRLGSNKDCRHLELDIARSGLQFQVGDALGVWPRNDPELVDAILAAAGAPPETVVRLKIGRSVSMVEALSGHLDLRKIPPKLLEAVGESEEGGGVIPKIHADPARRDELRKRCLDVLDLLQLAHEARPSPQVMVDAMGYLTPRLYSIASSPRAFPGHVHLTVAIDNTLHAGRLRRGVCSTFMCERVRLGETMPVYVQPARHFGLPKDGRAPVIMVGPGTGVAPFRAFLQERKALGASGPNWLFFGDQKKALDFMYREEFEALAREGVLTRLSTAFSRDQDYKIYVQDKMREESAELWEWLESGAYFYVCGDASRMAKDVDAALHQIIGEQGGKSHEEASEYVQSMRENRRYLKDVY